ncbi:carboxymuconolactone decarboxylase family protein [Gordonia neofelifaecis]|uniref:Carboxymuconolactone decarboxylase-like domain-containing protein n=1 Tax=Gordonia neofelifaecis NRRL B-59395 TaxID=644548 RepID=F1YPW0_9ACTN|nr:carboxymuconolactone decarboxylase family protein [Gordonia neofelifaecis]EGD53249.1 hypothetical protein SCNU_19857 [Gordonia neofelifaecis NRRL B-59395]
MTAQNTASPIEGSPYPVVEGMKESGAWNELWDGVYDMDPDWTEQYMAAAMEPYLSGVLSPKVVQLLCIAVDAAATHMYAPGTRRHMQAALDMGVTPEEILEVLKLTTLVGVHSCNVGAPILIEEMAARGLRPQSRGPREAH